MLSLPQAFYFDDKQNSKIDTTQMPITLRDQDAYFSADVETDGPIPGPYSMLSFALVFAGTFDGKTFKKPATFRTTFYRELQPISQNFQVEALKVNGLNRSSLIHEGETPQKALTDAFDWVMNIADGRSPVLVAYPVSFDWTWLYWYFSSYSDRGSPFEYSRCYDLKTAVAIKTQSSISSSGRSKLPAALKSKYSHTHNALDDAIEQAEIFTNIFDWDNRNGTNFNT